MTTYTAAISTASDVVAGDNCDVCVAENILTGDDEEVMGDTIVLDAIETTVSTDNPDKLTLAREEAEQILLESGWVVTGPWTIADNAMYASVEN